MFFDSNATKAQKIAAVESLRKNPALIAAVKNIKQTAADSAPLIARAIAIKTQVLEEMGLMQSAEWGEVKAITKYQDAYLADEAEANAYFAECESRQAAAGLEATAPYSCILIELEHKRVQADTAALQVLCSIVGWDYDSLPFAMRPKILNLLNSI